MSDVVKDNPVLAEKAKQTLADCDWYDENGDWRTDGVPVEDLVVATMLHFALSLEATNA